MTDAEAVRRMLQQCWHAARAARSPWPSRRSQHADALDDPDCPSTRA